MCFFTYSIYLHQNGKQVILTSDKAPVDMQDIEQRLLSRFKWGLSAELHQPDYETRISILKNILYRDGVDMPDEILEYVARNIKSNVRELEGAIISLIAQSSFNKKEVTLELAKNIVEKFVKNVKREISIDYIQKVVSDYFQLDLPTFNLKLENVTWYKLDNWLCFLQKNSPKHRWQILVRKLEIEIMQQYFTLAKQLITLLLPINNSKNLLKTSTKNYRL
jgi:chromosomal replication initiator protein